MTPPKVALLASLLLLPAAPAGAFDVFLDHNTDNDPTTFTNLVEGPVTAPVDVIVSFDAADLGTTSLSFLVKWGYGPPNPGGSQGCYDVKGDIDLLPGTVLPDQGPFSAIVADRCICRFLRCSCDAEMLFQASVNVTQPGNYVLATLDFTRTGFEQTGCGDFTWVQSDFEAVCIFPACDSPGDPRSKMTITDGSTEVENSSWGRVKSLYQ